MAVTLPSTGPFPPLAPGGAPARSPASVWQAPLMPAALAVTAGIVADRYARVPLAFGLACLIVSLAAWFITRSSKRPGLPLIYLSIAGISLGAAYHHWYRDSYPPDDIGCFATDE